MYTSLRIRSMPKANWREFDDPSTSQPNRSEEFVEPAERNVRVQRTRGGKRGKTVTVISGLGLNTVEARALLKRLKTCCGTGGTLKEEVLEIQGDQLANVLELLNKEGYRPKQSGG